MRAAGGSRWAGAQTTGEDAAANLGKPGRVTQRRRGRRRAGGVQASDALRQCGRPDRCDRRRLGLVEANGPRSEPSPDTMIEYELGNT
jgi:hypothetical protein